MQRNQTQSDALRVWGPSSTCMQRNQTHSGWHSQGGGTFVTDDERNQMLRADDERNQAQSGAIRVADVSALGGVEALHRDLDATQHGARVAQRLAAKDGREGPRRDRAERLVPVGRGGGAAPGGGGVGGGGGGGGGSAVVSTCMQLRDRAERLVPERLEHTDALRCTQMHSDALRCTRASRAHALGRLPACSVAP